jgi:hypothetical protein
VSRAAALGLLVGGALALAGGACNHSTPTEPIRPTPTPVVATPTPTPTPAPYPSGIPDATAFENLALVTRLEHEARANSFLVTIRGDTELSGRLIIGGAAWYYHFLLSDPAAASLEAIWRIWDTGQVTYYQYVPPIFNYEVPGIEGELLIDSPQAIQIALGAGIAPFTAEHPDAIVNVWYWRRAGTAICQMQFFDRSHVDRCEPMVYIDAATGEVLATDLGCIGGS